jgi:g-D-glutamyl-meso-diaminopimelate peptidase
MECFPDYDSRKKIIADLLDKYDFLECNVIGKSACGRDIDLLRLGNDKSAVLWAGAFHGMEWLTSLVLLKFVSAICEHIKRGERVLGVDPKQKLNQRGLAVVPCVNPDGVEISLNGSESAGKYSGLVNSVIKGDTSTWQANARGVDLNHNYNAGWKELKNLEIKNGITSPAVTRYGGPWPESETETVTITNLCRKNNFDNAIAFHSQGEEIYWKYGPDIPVHSEQIAIALAFSSGYELSAPEGLAVGGGFKDWFIAKMHRPAFTVEIGKGKNPLPLSDLNPVYDKLENMLFLSAFMQWG